MSDTLTDVPAISGSALKAQRERIKIIAENIANANSTASTVGGTPYQRQIITFKDEYDKSTGAYMVKTNGVQKDNSEFIRKLDPSNPAADKDGYVLTPNINPLIEMMDMSDANRAYQANLGAIDASKTMVQHTLSLLQ